MVTKLYFDKNFDKRECLKVVDGYYRNYRFCIFSLGSHPVAYVEIPSGHPYYHCTDEFDIIDIPVHGGCTFYKKFDKDEPDFLSKGTWIGWDYAHAGDLFYHPPLLEMHGHEWTLLEVYEDVERAINKLIFQERGE